MSETIFTRILSGELPSAKVYEDEHVFAFMDAGQVNPGHVIVATKRPYETLMDADDESAQALMGAAARIARALDAAFRPDGVLVMQANRPAAWQTVPHLHLHVLPRHGGDGVEITWPRKEPSMDELSQLAARIQL